MTAVETASATMGTTAACDALGVSRAALYRRRQPARSPGSSARGGVGRAADGRTGCRRR